MSQTRDLFQAPAISYTIAAHEYGGRSNNECVDEVPGGEKRLYDTSATFDHD
jgi:hypothetical protein